MVTQEGRPSSNKEDEAQDRNSLAVAAIRRGDVQISEPILWVEGVPDAASTRHTVSSIVSPEEAGISKQQDEIHGVAVSTEEEHQTTEVSGEPQPLRREPSTESIQEARKSQGRSTPSNQIIGLRNSTMEYSPTSSDPLQTKRKRKSGTIRTVFRKVFGRREKSNSNHISPPQSRAGPKHEHSRSVSFSI